MQRHSSQITPAAQAGVNVSIPLFQGGRPAALQRQAQARSAAALETVIAAERDVIAQVRSAYSSWLAASSLRSTPASWRSASESAGPFTAQAARAVSPLSAGGGLPADTVSTS